MINVNITSEIIKEETEEQKLEQLKTSESKLQKIEEKELYFIIYYQRKQKENPEEIIFSEECVHAPQAIFIKEIKTDNNKFTYKKVFKYKNNEEKKNVELVFFFGEKKEKYIINFEINNKTFIYDVDLNIGHKFLDNIPKENINQKIIEYEDKLELFLDALKQNKEENKIEVLYQETIELYSKKSIFSLLISLFTKVYQENKLCKSLLQIFYDMNIKIGKEEIRNNLNSDRNLELENEFNSLMTKVETESENLIKTNEYPPIHFYGLLICYFNYYDYKTYESLVDKLYKEQPELFYEILLVFFSHFFKPVQRDESNKEIFINFFKYIIYKKEYSYFKIGLRYISNIDTLIIVNNETKKDIYE